VPGDGCRYFGKLAMTEDTSECSVCGRVVRKLTAARRNGMCAPCHRNHARPPEERFANDVFETIEATIKPFTGHKKALEKLQALAHGYSLCFAYHYVHADILNGGISQLYSNSTWSLILEAENAANTAGQKNVATLLREVVYYYHKKGRSKHKLWITEDYFAALPPNWNKSLNELDAEYFALEDQANSVILNLCRDHRHLFFGP
jgi:hypothetical protein